MKGKKFDFCGWATKNNLRCSDGRTIKENAFQDDDGKTVPLVWNHQHNNPLNVLGHALLENRPEGVYAYCTFNDTESGQTGKLLVKHGDISGLSIYANKLKQNGGDVLHGVIREVSLVLASANPGAYIDTVIEHSDDVDEEAIIFTGEELELEHAEPEEQPEEETPKKKEPEKEKEMAKDKTIQDVIDTMTEEQKTAMYALIGKALEDGEEKGKEDMKHNVFDGEDNMIGDVLTHADIEDILTDAKRFGSLKDSVIAHAAEYGIENIDLLFPDDRAVQDEPVFLRNGDDSWVRKVMDGVHHTPFSRIKSMAADLREDEARAKGYFKKGTLKKEEVFALLKRPTGPTTIYKKQKLDRDDMVDITDFDVVRWLKKEMRMMLDEEIARAILVGDGRGPAAEDKINEICIRPIYKDTEEDLYAFSVPVNVSATDTDDQKAKATIRAIIKNRKNYRGTGKPTFFCTEDTLTNMLLMEDETGRVVYDTEEKLATALRVKEIVTVPVMENQTRTDAGQTYTLAGIVVNLNDYNVGADKGGAVSMFEDFDIDYNQQKYLIETRCSGALVTPKSAMIVELVEAEG